jgi:hypothetical protein
MKKLEHKFYSVPCPQTLFMMLGKCICMGVYLILKHFVYKATPEKVDGINPKPMNPFVLWPVGLNTTKTSTPETPRLLSWT